jgi:ankyrin repeat protein
MDTLPLPPSPSFEQYQKLAKDLVKAAKSEQRDAVRAWARDWVRSLAKALGVTEMARMQPAVDQAVGSIEQRVQAKVDAARAANEDFALSDAQFFIASAHGFVNWAEFSHHLRQPFASDRTGREFEAAVDAVVSGDMATLESLVRQRPNLVRAHSAREHRATLLHYVAANGVEDYRQRTPKNAVEVARFLLESGAEVDAVANTYGGDWWQTTMNLLVSSAHPAGAGLQSALVDVLADFGAAVNGLKDDETPLLTALEFGYIAPAETLVQRGARVDNVVTAAAMGRLDLVRSFVIDKKTLKPRVPLIAPPWRKLPSDAETHIELAFVWACKFARIPVADFFLDIGVDPAAQDGYKMTALHWAAANGCMSVIERLLEQGAPLEVENMWGGTVLDSTMHFVLHQPVKSVDYAAVFELLLAAGANPNAVDPSPSGNARVDDVLRRYRGRAGTQSSP